MNMRPSRVLAKFRAGRIATCMKLNFSDARVAEMAAGYGFDCLWQCMEHIANTWEQIENQVRAAKIYDVDSLVRVARGSYSNMIRALEMDAAGIIIPHVLSAEEAEEIARLTRFHPVGRRPIDGGNADAVYCRVSIQDYVRQANEQRIICVQIEDPEALDDIERIAKVDGITMFYFGPQDFSHAIGLPGQKDHPDVQEARRRVAQVAKRHGKFVGTSRAGLPIKDLAEMGYQLITVGSDVLGLMNYWNALAEEVNANPLLNPPNSG
ncbi:MAG: aldolase [Phycisphaerae bacterium]|nr:aldolase [Phycisphaerae bacterium]